MKLSLVCLLLSGLILTIAEPLVPQRGAIREIKRGVAGPNPYIFLTVPRGRSQSVVHGFEVVEDDGEDDADEVVNLKPNSSQVSKEQNEVEEEDDDDEEEGVSADNVDVEDEPYANDDDDEMQDESDEQPTSSEKNAKPSVLIANAQSSQMMVSREHAGAIMVPDEIIEVEGHSLIDEKTGKSALLLPRSVLDSIPDGSVVALLEQPVEARSEERANRVIVRRRRKGSRRNVRRRRGNNNVRRRRRGGNRRRRVNRNGVRVVRVGGNRRRNVRRGNVRRGGNRRRVVYQG